LLIFVRFRVLTALSMKVIAFWDIAPRSLVEVDQHLRGAYCLYHQGDEILPLSLLWWWGQYPPLKHWSAWLRLHDAICHKAIAFAIIVVVVVDDDDDDEVRLCLWTAATFGPVVHPSDDTWVWSHSGMNLTGKNRKIWR
jgi:hypothetical protein